jgi:lysophospholipase L1-like esterase
VDRVGVTGPRFSEFLCALVLSVAPHPHVVSAGTAELGSTTCPIAAFGDSITWGSYAAQNTVAPYLVSVVPASAHLVGPYDTSYPGDLARALHVPVCNYGVVAELILHGRSRFHHMLRQVHPHLVVLMEGVNDLASRRSHAAVLRDLRAMVRDARAERSRVLLATLVPTYYPRHDRRHGVNARVRALNRSIRALARADHLALANVERAFLRDPRGASLTQHDDGLDYLHPNDDGYRLLAGTVAGVIREDRLLTPTHA